MTLNMEVTDLTDEENFIIESFKRNFSQYADEPLVLYGLGRNTRVILDNCPDSWFAGLMDGVRTGEIVWNLPVLSLKEVKRAGIKKIIILATATNVPIIYRRIEKFCRENGITVYDINGTIIETIHREYIFPEKYMAMTEENLKNEIIAHDVISFDIFDTLLVRRNLLPTDVFENVFWKNKANIPGDLPFVRMRISCERELYLDTNPTIQEIYRRLIAKTGISENLGFYLMEQEIKEEHLALYPRKSIMSMVDFALKMGKTVCCTSDMYLPEKVLREFLHEAGYPDFDKIFVSCEFRCGKCDDLYKFVRDNYKGKKLLHIGDNDTADGKNAESYGIDTFLISSIYQMIEDSKLRAVLDCAESLTDRNTIGSLFSYVFNNPFLFSETQGKGIVRSEYDMGFYFLEPIIRHFLVWMTEQCKKEGIDCVLLSSRDGWLIRDMLQEMEKYMDVPFAYHYFYVSRTACTLAGMMSEEDAKYAAGMTFDGSLEELLSERFMLNKSEIKERMQGETDEMYLERHLDIILKNAAIYRSYYKEYIEKQGIAAKKMGFFDFVSSGTCQLWLENIMGRSLHGLYFIRNLDPYKDRLSISSMYKPQYVYEKQSKVYDNYIFMESILTSPEPSLKYILHGNLVFEEETRAKDELLKLKSIHKGIKDAFVKHIKDQTPVVSRRLAETMLEFIRQEFCKCEFNFFEESILEDKFCNRSFALKNIV